MKNSNEGCPVTGSCGKFCWRKPVHVVLFLAVLPFALAGAKIVWSALTAAFNSVSL